ncbi:hypothetical protein J6590_016780 [Homalodisca vitripennis]|nr:hypothetical protein J6590_016780 [Homalodisca vitripennis]
MTNTEHIPSHIIGGQGKGQLPAPVGRNPTFTGELFASLQHQRHLVYKGAVWLPSSYSVYLDEEIFFLSHRMENFGLCTVSDLKLCTKRKLVSSGHLWGQLMPIGGDEIFIAPQLSLESAFHPSIFRSTLGEQAPSRRYPNRSDITPCQQANKRDLVSGIIV